MDLRTILDTTPKVNAKGDLMTQYEYKVVPAPKTSVKAKGLKTSEERFAHTLQTAMNELGAQGWKYQRTDTLPCEERSGFTKRVTTFQNMLVFRRTIATAAVVETPVARMMQAPPATIETPKAEAPKIEAPKVAAKPLGSDPARPEPQVAAE